MLDGGREAADVGGISAEGGVDTREEGVGRGEGKGGELRVRRVDIYNYISELSG